MEKRTIAKQHVTVLSEEAVAALALHGNAVVVDATAGGGGHSKRIASELNKKGTLVVNDIDPQALLRIRERLGEVAPTVLYLEANFRNIEQTVGEQGIHQVDAVLADLGWSSEQFEGSGKGFSFKEEYAREPLLMTLGDEERYPFTARDIVNEWKEEDVANVLYGYGEERYARRIAKKIVEMREQVPIETAGQLVAVIESAVPARYRHGKTHAATKTFQALRIAVNDELDALTEFIDAAVRMLSPQGRLAIITFHSIEDRLVKHAFRQKATDGQGTVITKKPLTPSKEEVALNPRARSAKLRIFEKNDTHRNKVILQ